ncbi:zinc finger protein ZFAT [Biomphalaria glabrata]|nr:zinc finger protein ZFAT [Biomphalaria glabrata]
MPHDTFICGSCQETFTDLNDFVNHKKSCPPGPEQSDINQTVMAQSRAEIIQLHMNESGVITGMTSDTIGERGDKLNNVPQLVFLTDASMTSDLGRTGLDESGMEDNSASSAAHLIILNSSLADLTVKTETSNGEVQETDPLRPDDQSNKTEILLPIKKKRAGRSKAGEGKIKLIEAVPPTTPRPTVAETTLDGKLLCPQCKRTFTKERHFNTHKCLASSSYVDISKKEIVKIDSDEEDEGADLELDAGAQDDAEDEFHSALDDMQVAEKEDEEDEKEMEKGEQKDNDDWTWNNRKGKKRKRSSYQFDIDLHMDSSGAKQMKVAAEAMEHLPIFKTDEEKVEFETCIDVDLSQVDNMFRIHIIEQELNETIGMTYNTPTMSSLSVYICNMCEKVFKSLSHIRLHCVTHTDLKPFHCNKCKFTTNSKGNLYTHMRKHTGQFYRCEQCEFKTVNKSHLVEHMMTHDNRRSQCMICQKDYSTLKSLINHVRKYHTDKKGKEYLQTFLQGRGMKGRTVIHQCHICNRKFKKKLDRDRHLLVHDIKELPHVQQCELCDYWASRRVYLDKHYLKHRVIYCCALCNQKFLSTTRLTEHLTSTHSNDIGDVVFDKLLEECISRSLYLPEPLNTASEGSKYVNLPEELREIDQTVQNTESQQEQNKMITYEINLTNGADTGQPSTATVTNTGQLTEEQSNDFVSEYRKFIHESGTESDWKTQSGKDSVAKVDDVMNSLPCGDEGEEPASFSAQRDLDSNSPSLMLQTPDSEDDEDINSKVSSAEASNADEGVVRSDASKEEKIEALIKRLGYRSMTMQIFNKMRETFGTEECEFCGRLFYSKVDYEPHLRTHTGHKPFACALCSFHATTKDQLKKHSEKEHEKVAFQCKECDFLALSRNRLWNHQLKHLGINGLSCPQCPEKFEGMKQLRAHIINTHKEMDRETVEKLTGYRHKPFGKMGRRSFKCPHCPRVFIRANSELQKHIWIHEGIKPFSCPMCPYACRSKNNLQAHMLRHSAEKPFSCSECGKDYKSRTALRWHVRAHTSGKLFICDKCPYKATQSSHLKRHMETHDILKRFLCRHCDFSANTLGYMKIHYAKIHKGKEFVHEEVVNPSSMSPEKRVYKCLSCGYLFGNLSDLKRHLKIRHHVQMQDIAGMEQMQISEVEVVQYEDGSTTDVQPPNILAKQSPSEEQTQGELQLQIPNEDGSLSVSASYILQQLIGMSQNGETKLRVVNENGQPLDISVQQDGQFLFTGGSNESQPSNQFVIYYNNEEMSPSVCDSSTSANIPLMPSRSQVETQMALVKGAKQDSQFISSVGADVQMMIPDGELLHVDVETQVISQESDSDQLIPSSSESQLTEAENGQYVHAEQVSYNSDFISDHKDSGHALVSDSSLVGVQELSALEIVEASIQ